MDETIKVNIVTKDRITMLELFFVTEDTSNFDKFKKETYQCLEKYSNWVKKQKKAADNYL